MTFSRKMLRLCLSSALLVGGLTAFSATTHAAAATTEAASSAKLQSSIVTISSHGYAQVDATYAFHLNKGANRLVLDKLPSQLVTSSVKTDRFSGSVMLGPISYRAANLNAEAIEAALLNKEVTLVVPGASADRPTEITGKLLSFDGSTAVIEDKDSYVRKVPSVQGWRCKPLPDGLNNTPSLTLTLEAEEAGDYIGVIRFRTRGVGYSTSHTWTYNEEAATIDWATDVLVKNQSGATLSNVELNVAAGDTGADEAGMAGDANLELAAAPQMAAPAAGGGANFRAANVRQVETEDLAGVQIFSVPGKATLVRGEEQMIPFYRSAGSIPVKRENRVRAAAWYVHGQNTDSKVVTILTFTNTKESGLGLPIPSGPVSVQARNQRGTLMTVGGTNVSDVALEQEVASEIGSDWNLKATRKIVDYSTTKPVVVYPEGSATQTDDGQPIRYLQVVHTWNLVTEVKNGKDSDVEVAVEEFANHNFQLQNGNHGFKHLGEGLWESKIVVPAGKSTEIRYTIKRTEITSKVEPVVLRGSANKRTATQDQ